MRAFGWAESDRATLQDVQGVLFDTLDAQRLNVLFFEMIVRSTYFEPL